MFRYRKSDPAIEKFFQNGKPGLGRFASCVATSTRIAVFGIKKLPALVEKGAGSRKIN